MINRWLSKNVDLELLAQKVEDFFKERGLKARVEKKSPNEYVIHIIIPHEKQRRKIVTAKIYGEPNDFFVELPAKDHSFISFGTLVSMFGGGFLVLKEVKDKEFLGNLENDFWIYMEKVVQNISEK